VRGALALVALAVLAAAPAAAQGRSHHATKPRASAGHHQRAPKAHAEPTRSRTAKDAFLRQTGHPHGWPGHIVDHVVPLACGGADDPANMQWQTTEEAKAKDQVERQGCPPRR